MISNPAFIWILSLVNLAIICMALLFAYESVREQEPRAPKWGAALTAFHILLGIFILSWPAARLPIGWVARRWLPRRHCSSWTACWRGWKRFTVPGSCTATWLASNATTCSSNTQVTIGSTCQLINLLRSRGTREGSHRGCREWVAPTGARRVARSAKRLRSWQTKSSNCIGGVLLPQAMHSVATRRGRASSKLPALPDQHVDGRSFVPALKQEEYERGPIYWHFPHYSNHGYQSPNGAIRSGRFKLIVNGQECLAQKGRGRYLHRRLA